MSVPDATVALLNAAARVADEHGGHDIVALDVSSRLAFSDAFLLVSAPVERVVIAIARELERRLGEAGAELERREGREAGRWALLDFTDIVVHVFHDEERAYYGLDRLWRDCPVVPLELAPGAHGAK